MHALADPVAEAVDPAPTDSVDRSFASFFAEYYQPALRLAALLEGDTLKAEDAVCEAFARVYGRWRKGAIADVESYLKRAVVNTVRSGWRRKITERKHASTFEREAQELTRGRAFEASLVQRDAVWAALQRIPAGQRRVVVLRYYEDLTEAQVAELLGISIGTVKSQAAKGFAALQAILEVER